MIGKIGPLVQGGSSRSSLLALHVLGGITGALVMGALLGFIGLAIAASLPWPLTWARIAVLAVAGFYLGASDLGLSRIPQLSIERQTPGVWMCTLGTPGSVFAWGCDLGSGITTRLSYQSLLLIPLYALLAGDVFVSMLTMVLFGLARTIMVLITILAAGNEVSESCDLITSKVEATTRAVGAAGASVGAIVIVSGALAHGV